MTCPESLKKNHEAIMKTGGNLKEAGCAGGECATHDTVTLKASTPAQPHKSADCPSCG